MKREQQAAVKNHTLPPRHYLTMRRVLGTRLVIEWSSPVLPPLLFILVRIYQNFSVSLQTRLCHWSEASGAPHSISTILKSHGNIADVPIYEYNIIYDLL
jgi:hypothetical protein